MTVWVILIVWLITAFPVTLFIGKVIRYSDVRYEMRTPRPTVYPTDTENAISLDSRRANP